MKVEIIGLLLREICWVVVCMLEVGKWSEIYYDGGVDLIMKV